MIETIWGGEKAPFVNQVIGDFVASRIWSDGRHFENYTSLGVVSHETLIAGVIYNNWSPETGVIEISGAGDSPKWLSRAVLYQMYEYPFEQLGCRMVIQRNSEHNERINSILRRLGFQEYRIEQMRGPDEAELIFTLTKEQWKKTKYYKELSHGNSSAQNTDIANFGDCE